MKKRPSKKDGLLRNQTVLRYKADGSTISFRADVHKFVSQGFEETYVIIWRKTDTLIIVQPLAPAGGHLQGVKGDYVWWDDDLVKTQILHLEGGAK